MGKGLVVAKMRWRLTYWRTEFCEEYSNVILDQEDKDTERLPNEKA